MKTRNKWSYSSAAMYLKCGYLYNESYNKGNRSPSGPAAERGEMIHQKGEHYLLGNIKGVPREYKHFDSEMKNLLRLKAIPEQDWAFTKQWKVTEWDAPNVWVRAKLDVHLYSNKTLSIIDHKTGRVYPTHEEQAELYTACGLVVYPDVKNIAVEMWYLDQDSVGHYDYTVKQAKALKTKWNKIGVKVTTAKSFPKTPGDHCKWCHLRSDKGGKCAAWKKV